MSSPACRTALSELANRRTSPSSAQIATEVTGPSRTGWRPAAGLTARQQAEQAAQWVQLGGQPVDLAQPGLDCQSPGRRQLHLGDRRAPARRCHAADRRRPMVEQRRGDPLVPGHALIQQVLVQPDGGPRLQHVFRRDPGLRQVPSHPVHPQVLSVGLAGLAVPLLPRSAAVSAGSARCGRADAGRLGPDHRRQPVFGPGTGQLGVNRRRLFPANDPASRWSGRSLTGPAGAGAESTRPSPPSACSPSSAKSFGLIPIDHDHDVTETGTHAA